MENRRTIRLAVIGIGNIGRAHVAHIDALPDVELVAVCDIDRAVADSFAQQYGADAYYSYQDLLKSAALDGIVVATPHYEHVQMTIDALTQGVHVLVEKPIAVHAKAARKMIAAYEAALKTRPDLVFAAMFMQRTYGYWQKIKDMITGGELGQLMRTTWIVTNWFRTQYYYDSGGWRATWRGEGGGVLLNQCPHNLDLYQWLVGMPQRVTGFAKFGKYHDIEVEDEVTTYFEHPDGMIGHFITTTAESPGTNRLEIVG
ncbi:MAG: Gfo/Idh/MocA family oxidoreductase, partial [Anaerolineae bacterium]|nr:Gfo/Idh/MocA family oxidoreductase [Anaerolineae bacterium]